MINLTLKDEFVANRLNFLLKNGILPESLPKKQKIIIDMSSPNIAKEMHTGHLRSTMIGESFSRLYSFFGHEVVKVNHIGDWGTQFGMLIAKLKASPDFNLANSDISDLQKLYKDAKSDFDSDPDFAKASLSYVKKLQDKDAEIYSIWKKIVDVSMESNLLVFLGAKSL